MADLKESKEAVAGEVLTSLGGFAPPMLLALAERLGTRVPQHTINTVTTNVPGPQQPLYAAGRRMLEAFPYVPLGGHVRVGVAIFSYDGALTLRRHRRLRHGRGHRRPLRGHRGGRCAQLLECSAPVDSGVRDAATAPRAAPTRDGRRQRRGTWLGGAPGRRSASCSAPAECSAAPG